MKKETSFIGQVDLLSLLGAEFKKVDSTDCIVIPVNMNPTIELIEKKKGGIAARLNIFVNDADGKFGNSHYIVPSVSKRTLERFSLTYEEARQFCPIIGNLKMPVAAPDENKPEAKPQALPRTFNNTFIHRN